MKKSVAFGGIMVALSLLPGCAGKTWLAQPDFNPAGVKRIGVVVPNATVKMIDVVGNLSIDQDLSAAARTTVAQGTVDSLKNAGYDVVLLNNHDELVSFLKGYGPLAREIQNHFPGRGTATVPSKIDGFAQIRKNENIDCVVAVEGLDHHSTAARKAKMVGLALLGFSGGQGLTYIQYNAFCGDDGKPMFSELFSKSSDITDKSDVTSMVDKIVDHMKGAAM